MTENSFTNSYQDWREGTFENFKAWSLDQFCINPKDSDDEAEVPVNMVKVKDISFEKNWSGVCVLPPMGNYKTIKQKQRVMRGYIGATYSQPFPSVFFLLFF